jgi:hypothetical protein
VPVGFGKHENHVVLVDIFIARAIPQLERATLMSEDCEAERRVETLGRGLVIPNRQDDFFQPGECRGTLQHFGEQAPGDPLAAMLPVDKHTPNSGLVALFAASVPSETHGSYQLSAGKSAQHIVIAAGGGQAPAEDIE